MPKLTTGIDLIEINRFEGAVQRHGTHLLERIFTASELDEFGESVPSLAARFAAKEAVTKALGTGIGQVTWHDIEILRGPAQAPTLHLNGKAEDLAEELGLVTWSVSLSHTIDHAVAMVVAMGS